MWGSAEEVGARDFFCVSLEHGLNVLIVLYILVGGTNGLELDRESTLTQLLAEMDGFQSKSEIVVMATTNRLDLLDEALMRSGRFDLHVKLDPPDIQAREALFKHYLQMVNVSDVGMECSRKVERGEPIDRAEDLSDEVQVRVPPATTTLQPSLKPDALLQSSSSSPNSNNEPEKKRRSFICIHDVARLAFSPLDVVIRLLKFPFVGWERNEPVEQFELSKLHCLLAKQMAGLTAGENYPLPHVLLLEKLMIELTGCLYYLTIRLHGC